MAVRGMGTTGPESPAGVVAFDTSDTLVAPPGGPIWRFGLLAGKVMAMAAAPKAQRRADLLAARRTVPQAVREDEAERLCGHLAQLVAGSATVCAYLPLASEPGSEAMVARLAELCETVLLPVTRAHQPLRWGRYVPGDLVSGEYGLQEPPGPLLGPDEVTRATVVLVPALAVDRRGVRLGRGGGFYDRSLVRCGPQTRLVAVVRDCELVDDLPDEPHDVRMTHALTPAGGLVRLGE